MTGHRLLAKRIRPVLLRRYFPWFERNGQFSPFKLATLVLLCLPALWVFYEYWTQTLGPKPGIAAVREVGSWGVRFLIVSLAITPLRFATGWSKFLLVRRMIGLAALAYLLAHFALYMLDQQFDLIKIATEIVLRFYLTIGFVALLGMIALGATSKDSIIKRMGGANWSRLHALVYPIAGLGLLHFFLQAKIEIYEPTLLTGLFFMLMADRQLRKRGAPKLGWKAPAFVALAGIASALAIALFEAAWRYFRNDIDPLRVLAADFDFSYSIAPNWWVLLGGLGLAAVVALRVKGWLALPGGKKAPARDRSAGQSAAPAR